MTIIELIKLIKPIPELFIGIHNIFCLEAFINGWYYPEEKALDMFFVLFNTFYKEIYKTSLW